MADLQAIADHVEVVTDSVGDARDPQTYVDYETTAKNIRAAVDEAYRAGLAEMQGRCRVIAEGLVNEARMQQRMLGADASSQERTAQRIAGMIAALKY